MKNRKNAIHQAGPDSGRLTLCELCKDSSQAAISTLILQMRNIKLREVACQETQLKKRGDGRDPPPQPACSRSFSLQRPRALHETSAHQTLCHQRLSHRPSRNPCSVLTVLDSTQQFSTGILAALGRISFS